VSTGSGKDVPASRPENLSADSTEGLLTSEDLFGDLVDEPIRNETPAVSAGPTRAAPIRVQVNEAGEATAPKPKPAHVLPEDMSVLLDAFADSSPQDLEAPPPRPETIAVPETSVAPKTWVERRPSPLAGEEEDLSGLLDSMAPTAPVPSEAAALVPEVDTEAGRHAPGNMQAPRFDDDVDLAAAAAAAAEAVPEAAELGKGAVHEPPPGEPGPAADEDVALDGLLQEDDAGAKTLAPGKWKAPRFEEDVPPPAAAAPPPPRVEKPVIPPTDLDQLLEGVFAPATNSAKAPASTPASGEDVPGLGELLKSVPKPASRTATKFQAAAPKIAAGGESRMMLDLASLAEDALSQPAPPKAPRHAAGAGDQFGPYQLLEKVAAGGMAEVFRAKRTGVEGFEKIVALKRILPHLSDNKEFVDMFVDEAKMVAGLAHPNIVQIYDLGRFDDTYFIAMEYIHGRDLRTILRRAKDKGIGVPLDLCVLITGRVAAALEYAHRKKDEAGRALRIVHRDVSPQNILISFEGDVKLTDFGIAKATSKATSTDRGALRGKLLYMSPEQAMGKPMDRRADVFSLGVCFYEMLTDRKPFLGTSEKGILDMVRECRVSPPSLVNPGVTERIEKVVMKALEREPDQRYQDAGEMLRDLERALVERQAPTALELSRFMEVLFESEERGVAIAPEEPAAEEASTVVFDGLEIDLEPDEIPRGPAAAAAPAAAEPRPAANQAGFGKLLKKFGIK